MSRDVHDTLRHGSCCIELCKLHWISTVALNFLSCIEFHDTIVDPDWLLGHRVIGLSEEQNVAEDKTVHGPITVQLTLVSFRTCNNCSPSDSAPPPPLTSLLSIRCLCTSQYWLSWIKMLFTHCVFVSKPTMFNINIPPSPPSGHLQAKEPPSQQFCSFQHFYIITQSWPASGQVNIEVNPGEKFSSLDSLPLTFSYSLYILKDL